MNSSHWIPYATEEKHKIKISIPSYFFLINQEIFRISVFHLSVLQKYYQNSTNSWKSFSTHPSYKNISNDSLNQRFKTHYSGLQKSIDELSFYFFWPIGKLLARDYPIMRVIFSISNRARPSPFKIAKNSFLWSY